MINDLVALTEPLFGAGSPQVAEYVEVYILVKFCRKWKGSKLSIFELPAYTITFTCWYRKIPLSVSSTFVTGGCVTTFDWT